MTPRPLRKLELRVWADGEPIAVVARCNWNKALALAAKAEGRGSTDVHIETWEGARWGNGELQ